MKNLILTILALLAFSAHAITASNTTSKRSLKKLSEMAVDGLKFRAIQNAHNQCIQEGFDFCELKSVTEKEINKKSIEFTADVEGISLGKRKVVESDFTALDYSSWEKPSRFTSLEIDGIKFHILNETLEQCKAQKWNHCTLSDSYILIKNKRIYINENNDYGFASKASVYVMGIHFSRKKEEN